MTWTKLGDEWITAASDLTSDEYRMHVDATVWSNWRLLDLRIPKAHIRKLAEVPDPDLAIKGLVDKGWWEDCGDAWYVGLRFPEWQRDRAQVEQRREYLAEAKRRSRAHRAGDHSRCLRGKCAGSTVDGSVDSTVDPGRDGSGPTVPTVPQDQDPGPGQDRSAANSQDRRVHDGHFDHGPDDQHSSAEVHLQSPAADRNARDGAGPGSTS